MASVGSSLDPCPAGIKQEAKRGGAAVVATRSVERSRRSRRHMCSFYNVRSEGHQNSEMRQEREAKSFDFPGGNVKELPREQLIGGCRSRRSRFAYGGGRLGTQGTDPARRGDIGGNAGENNSTAPREIHKSVKNNAAAKFPARGGCGIRRLMARRRTATPSTAKSWLYNYKFSTLGPGMTSYGHGEVKLKGTVQV